VITPPRLLPTFQERGGPRDHSSFITVYLSLQSEITLGFTSRTLFIFIYSPNAKRGREKERKIKKIDQAETSILVKKKHRPLASDAVNRVDTVDREERRPRSSAARRPAGAAGRDPPSPIPNFFCTIHGVWVCSDVRLGIARCYRWGSRNYDIFTNLC